MRESKQIAVRPAIALAVLDELIREAINVLALVPRCDSLSQCRSPATLGLHELSEVE